MSKSELETRVLRHIADTGEESFLEVLTKVHLGVVSPPPPMLLTFPTSTVVLHSGGSSND